MRDFDSRHGAGGKVSWLQAITATVNGQIRGRTALHSKRAPLGCMVRREIETDLSEEAKREEKKRVVLKKKALKM